MAETRRGVAWGIDPAIMGVLQYLPPAGQPWPAEKRDAWLKAFFGVIDIVYPDESAAGRGDEGGGR